jgi:hypothetical protein
MAGCDDTVCIECDQMERCDDSVCTEGEQMERNDYTAL